MFQGSCRSLDPILDPTFLKSNFSLSLQFREVKVVISGKGKCQSFSHLFFHMGIAHMEIILISPCNKFTNQLADETDENSATKFLIILTKM